MMARFFSLLFVAASLLAEQADWIVSARYVMTMDGDHRLIEDGSVAIRADRIVAIGSRAEIARRYQAKQKLDRPNAIISPGLINTHTHAAMSLFRGIADDQKLEDWLTKYIFPAEAKNVSPDFVRWGTRLACLEMLLSGTTTFTDMYYFEGVVAEVAKEAGMRGVLGETVIGFPVADAKTPAEALKLSEQLLIRFKGDPLVVASIAPHALYTNSPETLTAARALANKYDAPILIHLAETKEDNDGAQKKYGKTAATFLDSIGMFNGRTVVAHGVWLNDADIAILKSRGTGVAHCPSSNMKLASGAAPVLKLLAAGVNVGLGPDGPAGSNNDFNMFEEMDLAAKLQKLVSMDPQALPARTAIEMATMGGARVLGLDKEIGSLESGKRADLITVTLDNPNAMPLYDVYSQMVYALKGSDVQDVFVNGRLVVRDRKALTLRPAEIRAKADFYRKQVSQSLSAPLAPRP
jgi:5-methylthioadenosine/S-adenosylhomocysteine deaminase